MNDDLKLAGKIAVIWVNGRLSVETWISLLIGVIVAQFAITDSTETSLLSICMTISLAAAYIQVYRIKQKENVQKDSLIDGMGKLSKIFKSSDTNLALKTTTMKKQVAEMQSALTMLKAENALLRGRVRNAADQSESD